MRKELISKEKRFTSEKFFGRVKWGIFMILAFLSGYSAESPYCLTFVHIGSEFPKHLTCSIAQARLFNPESPIFLLGNSEAFSKLGKDVLDAVYIPLESLKLSESHKKYIAVAKNTGFWRYALERFLFLDDFIQQYELQSVFHIENDVMLYFNLEKELSVFQVCYPNMMATAFDCDERAVPSFVYLDKPCASQLLASFIADRAHLNTTDMELLSLFKDAHYKTRGDHLPILIPSYAEEYPMTNIFKNTARASEPFSNHLQQLRLIFDAAALGQFLGGIDPILGPSKPGFMGEASVFLPMHFKFEWKKDEKGRWVPYIAYGNEKYPVANLHVHSKMLNLFLSSNQEMPQIPTECFSSLPFDHIKPKRVLAF